MNMKKHTKKYSCGKDKTTDMKNRLTGYTAKNGEYTHCHTITQNRQKLQTI